MTVKEFFASLREGRYTSLGSYPKFWVTSDGGVLSYQACLEECRQIGRAIRDNSSGGWCVVGCGINWEDPALYCDHTNERIESAYAEDSVTE
jgi:hypothetical protein